MEKIKKRRVNTSSVDEKKKKTRPVNTSSRDEKKKRKRKKTCKYFRLR